MKWTVLLCLLSLSAFTQAQTPSVIVLQPPPNVETFVAHTVRITCAAYGDPLPSDISWTGPDGHLTSGGRVKISTQPRTANATGSPVFLVSTLEICGVTVEDSGPYTCTVDHNSVPGSAGEFAASTVLSVVDEAAAPPAMVVIPPATASVNLWDNMQLMCVAYGNPLPVITWSGPSCEDIADKSCTAPGDVAVQSTTVAFGDIWFAQSVLQFCSIKEQGQYSCSASNGLTGTGLAPSSAFISVTVIGATEPPTEPKPSPSPSFSSVSSAASSIITSYSSIVTSSSSRTSSTTAPPTRPDETVTPTVDTILGVESDTAYIAGVAILALVAVILFVVLVIECIIFWMRKLGKGKFDPTAVHMSNTGDGTASIG